MGEFAAGAAIAKTGLDMAGSFMGGGQQENAAFASRDAYNQYAEKAVDATNTGYDTARGEYDTAYKEGSQFTDPYMNGNNSAYMNYLSTLGLLGKDAQNQSYNNFQSTPGYEFAMKEGLRGVDRSAAARGLNKSGSAIKGVLKYSQGLADQEFGKFQDRLQGLSSLGQSLAQGESTRRDNYGNNYADLSKWKADKTGGYYTGMGTNNANAELAAGNARAQSTAGTFNALSDLAGSAFAKSDKGAKTGWAWQ